MTERARILVHGATGFTGRLVCEELKRRAIPFAISGRSRDKLSSLCDSIGQVETHLVDISDRASIVAAMKERALVCACAGPFVKVGESVLSACAELGVHYVDTTGEQSFV